MNFIDVTMVRIYITESSNLLKQIIDYLTKEVNLRGISVFRAISGYGETGTHTTSLMDLSLDLPLVIEFFDDDTAKIEKAILHLNQILKSKHIVSWTAKVNA